MELPKALKYKTKVGGELRQRTGLLVSIFRSWGL